MLDSWYQIAGLLVPDSCTFLVLLFEILYSGFSGGRRTLFLHSSQQPQAVTLANPFIIPMHKNNGQKKSVSKTPCASVILREFFLTFVL